VVLGKKSIYRPANIHKYVGRYSKNCGQGILLKSNLERLFARHCDANPKIISWQYEGTFVPYYSTQQQKQRKYHIDFTIKMLNDSGCEEIYLIEIKPMDMIKQTRKRKHFEDDSFWIKLNEDKWKAADAYCKVRGWHFKIFTEKQLMRRGRW
jgi:hypothetical protein